jgi:hypothetical protein
MAPSPRVAQITQEANDFAGQVLAVMDQITPEQANAKLGGGWTVAATLAHIAAGYAPGTLRTVVHRTREGKSVNAPDWIIHAFNWLMSLQSKRQPLDKSRAQLQRDLLAALEAIADLSDADLDRRFRVSIIGEVTLEEYLRYTLVSHLEEHLVQIRRALGTGRVSPSA